jgi:DNA invertase Pin-like site-specific DNA recombinase
MQPSYAGLIMKVVEILRVSTQEQSGDDRAGIPRQKGANALTIEKHGLTIIKTIQIIDVSGTSVMHTPEIHGMITMLRSGQIGGVVVADWDRLIRLDNFNDFTLLQHFKETQTLIYLPDQVIDLNTQSGFLIGGFQSIISGNELTQIKKRMLAAKEVKRKNGEHPNCDITLPTGVSYDRRKKRFHYNEKSAKVKLLFNLFCNEGIRNYCELERRTGIKHRTVPNLLKNEIYIG